MAKKHKNVCLVTTVYSFFLYLLIKGYNEKDIFIFTAWFPKEVSKNIPHISTPPVGFRYGAKMYSTDSIKGILMNILGYCRYFYGYIKLRILLFIKTFNKDVSIYGHAQSPFSFMFYENKDSNIIEDGLMNYSPNICETHKINPIIDKFLHLCGIYFLNANEALGSHEKIKKVYLTREFDHPLIKDKVEVINMEKKWNSLSKDKQTEILNLLNVNLKKINFEGKTALILTQPFFEDNITSLEDELKIYDEYFDKFKDYNIIIKPHPRDEKDYNEIYPNVNIIDKHFPIELLTLINIKPTVVCSAVSTALLNFKDSEIYVYQGELKNERLKKIRKELLKIINSKSKKITIR